MRKSFQILFLTSLKVILCFAGRIDLKSTSTSQPQTISQVNDGWVHDEDKTFDNHNDDSRIAQKIIVIVRQDEISNGSKGLYIALIICMVIIVIMQIATIIYDRCRASRDQYHDIDHPTGSNNRHSIENNLNERTPLINN